MEDDAHAPAAAKNQDLVALAERDAYELEVGVRTLLGNCRPLGDPRAIGTRRRRGSWSRCAIGLRNGTVEERRDPTPPARPAPRSRYRVNVSAAGIRVYNRDGMTATDPYDPYPRLDLVQGDVPHAFYLGAELGRAQIAWQLGKRYVQDKPLK
jgi:hypothetical protein